MTVPEQVPSDLVAGDTWQWTREWSDYPAPTWTVTYYFENRAKSFSSAGSASGSAHAFTITAANSATYPAGRYLYRVRATDGSTVKTIEDGWVEVAVDPAAAGTHDTRSWARRTLEALEATIEGRASSDQLAMSINGRSLSRLAPSELLDWRDRLRSEVRAEDQAESAGLGRNIKVRFARA